MCKCDPGFQRQKRVSAIYLPQLVLLCCFGTRSKGRNAYVQRLGLLGWFGIRSKGKDAYVRTYAFLPWETFPRFVSSPIMLQIRVFDASPQGQGQGVGGGNRPLWSDPTTLLSHEPIIAS